MFWVLANNFESSLSTGMLVRLDLCETYSKRAAVYQFVGTDFFPLGTTIPNAGVRNSQSKLSKLSELRSKRPCQRNLMGAGNGALNKDHQFH
jgi:hypothetical protein